MGQFVRNEHALTFNLLLTAGFSIIILFAVLNIGSYINGTISNALADTMPTNVKSGLDYHNEWTNASTSGWKNYTLDQPAGEYFGTDTFFSFNTNSTWSQWFNLTTNGNPTNTSSLVPGNTWVNWSLTTLIANSNVSSTALWLNFTWDSNGTANRVHYRVHGRYYASGDVRSNLENKTYNTLLNVSNGYEDTVDIVVISAIITAITIPLAAVIAVKRLF